MIILVIFLQISNDSFQNVLSFNKDIFFFKTSIIHNQNESIFI